MEGWKTLRTERYRYVIDADGHEQLYDLRNDPAAYTDVAEDSAHRDELAGARHELLTRLIERERPLPRVWAY
jgi:arylsulfatase A-like enzyme